MGGHVSAVHAGRCALAVILPESSLISVRNQAASDPDILHKSSLSDCRSVMLSCGGSLIALLLCVPAFMFGVVARSTGKYLLLIG